MSGDRDSQPFDYSQNLAISKRFAANMLMSLSLAIDNDEQRITILNKAGISPEALGNPAFLISAEQELRAIALITAQVPTGMSAPVLGFQYGAGTDLSLFGVVGAAAQVAPNLFEAIRVTTQYPELLSGTALTAIHIEEAQTILSCQVYRPMGVDVSKVLLDQVEWNLTTTNLFIFERYISELGGQVLRPSVMMLPMPKPDDWHLVESDLQFDVRFDADEATLVYDADLREVPTKNPQPILHKLFLEQAETLAATLREDLSVKERVSRYLWTQTPPPGREEIARKLGLSVRSLSRHLQAEGASFKAMFLDIQLRRAKILLQDTKMSAAAIAFQLGFNDPASFTRSFKAQTGKAPAQWRDNK